MTYVFDQEIVSFDWHSRTSSSALVLTMDGTISNISTTEDEIACRPFLKQVNYQDESRIETVDEMESFLGRLVADPSLIAPAIADYALSQLARAGAREALAVVSGQLRAAEEEIAELVPELAAREVPVTILWGAEDRMVSPDRARAEQFGPLVEIAGAGHIAHVEAAKVVNKLLAERLAP